MIKNTILLAFSIAIGHITVKPRSSFGTKLPHVFIFGFCLLLLFLIHAKSSSGILQNHISQSRSELKRSFFSASPDPAHEFCPVESKTVASF